MTTLEHTIEKQRRAITFLRWTVLVLVVAIVIAGAAPFLVIADARRTSEREQLILGCKIVKLGVSNAEDLADLRRRFGLPPGPPIPEVPVECDGF